MICWWLCQSIVSAILGLFVIYKLIDRIIRIPFVGDYGNRYVLVTGANAGLGLDLVKRLDSLGCHVFAGSRSEQGETELRKTCSNRVHPISLDVAKPDSVQKAFKIVSDKLAADGNKKLWAVVNNAGVGGSFGPLEWLTIDDYRTTDDVNVYGCIDVTMTFLPLVKRSRGRIVNVSSFNGTVPFPYMTPYCMAKSAQDIFSATLRGWLNQYGCKVSIVVPGYHKTKIVSASATIGSIDDCWKRASPETKKEFGEDFHQSLRTGWQHGLDNMIECKVSDTTDANVHAILARYPRARYDVSWAFRLLIILQWFLPECIFDRLKNVFIPVKTLPAVLRK